jgi:hypothetical protein
MTKAAKSLIGIVTVALVAAISTQASAACKGVTIIRKGQEICNAGRPETAADKQAVEGKYGPLYTPEQWAVLERQHRYTDQEVLDELFRQRLLEYPQKSRR